jgi:hypothetical protein
MRTPRRLLWVPLLVVSSASYWTIALGLGMGSLTWLDEAGEAGIGATNPGAFQVGGEPTEPGVASGEATVEPLATTSQGPIEPILVHLVAAPEAPGEPEVVPPSSCTSP